MSTTPTANLEALVFAEIFRVFGIDASSRLSVGEDECFGPKHVTNDLLALILGPMAFCDEPPRVGGFVAHFMVPREVPTELHQRGLMLILALQCLLKAKYGANAVVRSNELAWYVVRVLTAEPLNIRLVFLVSTLFAERLSAARPDRAAAVIIALTTLAIRSRVVPLMSEDVTVAMSTARDVGEEVYDALEELLPRINGRERS